MNIKKFPWLQTSIIRMTWYGVFRIRRHWTRIAWTRGIGTWHGVHNHSAVGSNEPTWWLWNRTLSNWFMIDWHQKWSLMFTCACISWCNIKWVLWLDLRSKTRWDPTKIYSVILSVISIRWIYDEIYIYKKNFKKQTILTHQKKTFEHHKKRENSKVFVVDTHHEKVWSHSLWHREDHTHFLLGSLRYFYDTQHIQKS